MCKVGGKKQVNNILNKEESEESSTKNLTTSKVKNKKIDHFLAHIPTFLEQAQFEDQNLNITITNVLPSRKQLAGHILKSATETNKSYIQDKARNDSHGIMIAFDSWKNVINQEILGLVLIMSNDIMEMTEEIFREIDALEIKINRLVTDSDAAYAAS
ncbi:5279_t:CDS:2, partial [Cetraspora pellucida]